MVNMDKNTENIFRKTPIAILSLLARFSRQRHKLAIKKLPGLNFSDFKYDNLKLSSLTIFILEQNCFLQRNSTDFIAHKDNQSSWIHQNLYLLKSIPTKMLFAFNCLTNFN